MCNTHNVILTYINNMPCCTFFISDLLSIQYCEVKLDCQDNIEIQLASVFKIISKEMCLLEL